MSASQQRRGTRSADRGVVRGVARVSRALATGRLPKRKSGKRADVECAPLPQPDPSPAAKKAAGQKAAAQQAKRPSLKELTGSRGALLHR